MAADYQGFRIVVNSETVLCWCRLTLAVIGRRIWLDTPRRYWTLVRSLNAYTIRIVIQVDSLVIYCDVVSSHSLSNTYLATDALAVCLSNQIPPRRWQKKMRLLVVVAIWMLPCWAWAQVHHGDTRRRSAQERSCAVCGETGPSVVPWPDKRFSLDGIPLETCGQVEATGSLLTEGTAFCDVLQTVGPLCGCSVSPTACSLCWDGSPVANPRLELPSYPAADFLATSLPDVLLTCEMLDSILKTRNDANEDQCWNARLDVGDICGCPPLPMELDVPRQNYNNNNNSTAGSNTTEPLQDTVGERDPSNDTSQERCSLCPNGERPGNPDKPLNLVSSTMYTCSDWDRFASITAADSEDCSWFHAYATYCGCQVEETFCNLCPHGESVPKPDQPLNWYHTGFVSTRASNFHAALDPDYLTCDVMQSKVANERSANAALLGLEPEFFCLSVQLKSSICGCRPDWRPILLTWSYRLSGILSFIVRLNYPQCTAHGLDPSHACLLLRLGFLLDHLRCRQQIKKQIHRISPTRSRHFHI